MSYEEDLKDELKPNPELHEPFRTFDVTERTYRKRLAEQRASLDRLLEERTALLERINDLLQENESLRQQVGRLESGY